jgi:hypothetical protein
MAKRCGTAGRRFYHMQGRRSFVKETFSAQRLLKDMESLYLDLMGKEKNSLIGQAEYEAMRCTGEAV